MKTLCTVLNCHCILTLPHGHAYLQNLIFQQKSASFLKKKKTILEKINVRIWKYTKSKSNVTLDKFCSHLHLFGNFCQYQSEAK